MDNPERRKTALTLVAVLVAATVCAIIAVGATQKTEDKAAVAESILLDGNLSVSVTPKTEDKVTRPDHSGFTDCQPCHAEKYTMWEASGHSKALSLVDNLPLDQRPQINADCYACHSTEGLTAKLSGEKVDLANKGSFHTISCLACHKPGSDAYPNQLVADSEKLCGVCHTQRAVLEGRGAKGIEDTRSFHSGVACVSCHMSEGNHYMKVMRPDDKSIPEDRLDTCTRCHKDNNRKARAKQLPDWQEFYKEAMDPVEADLAEVNAALKQKPDLLNAELQAKLDTVSANLAIVRRDGSKGAHNLDFALEIAAQAKSDLKAIKAAINK
ncbi:MAG: hypothetical protein LBP68_03945 [Acidobacteriota bacterium]|jgi:predicted CXXCH cytochrome family protein|nr:hypothetical protein [Acidobacteriota bacterium]